MNVLRLMGNANAMNVDKFRSKEAHTKSMTI